MLLFRANHIGSLLRPKRLREAFRRHSQKAISDVELRAVQDQSIREVLRLQEDCGLAVATDGEFRRISYWQKFVRLTRGLEVRDAVLTFHDAEGREARFTAPYASGKVSRSGSIALDEFDFVRTQGGYDPVAERFFARTKVDHFLLEFDTPRAGGFAPLRFVPRGKGVVLGLVSSKTPVLETPGELRRRVDDASRHIDLSRLAISPQCGFASTMGGNPVTEADERAKLRLCVETARSIWGSG